MSYQKEAEYAAELLTFQKQRAETAEALVERLRAKVAKLTQELEEFRQSGTSSKKRSALVDGNDEKANGTAKVGKKKQTDDKAGAAAASSADAPKTKHCSVCNAIFGQCPKKDYCTAEKERRRIAKLKQKLEKESGK